MLLSSFSKVHLVLDSLRLTHALCLESLLGQVRVGRQLPWERGASLCIKEEEVLRFENDVKDADLPIFSGTQSKTLPQHFREPVCQ